MKKSYYFSHDYNARNDEKMLNLRCTLGWEGYGIYWAIVEMLYETKDLRLLRSSEKSIAYTLSLSLQKLQKVLYDFNLFEYDEQYFWSKSAAKRSIQQNEKSAKARMSALARWDKNTNIDNSEELPEVII